MAPIEIHQNWKGNKDHQQAGEKKKMSTEQQEEEEWDGKRADKKEILPEGGTVNMIRWEQI